MQKMTMTQSEFADRRGVSRAAVTKWKAKGFLVMTPDERIIVEDTEWALADRPDTNRGGKKKQPIPCGEPAKPTQETIVSFVTADETPAQAAERIVTEGAPHSHAEAARIKENYLALLRQIEFDQKSAAVVPIDVVIAGVVEQSARIRNKLLSLPTRVAPRAAVLRSSEEVRALVESEVALILQELTLDGHGHVSIDDVRDLLRERFATVH